jgi:hypothetical protein
MTPPSDGTYQFRTDLDSGANVSIGSQGFLGCWAPDHPKHRVLLNCIIRTNPNRSMICLGLHELSLVARPRRFGSAVFDPSVVNVRMGGKVVWTWDSSGHSVTDTTGMGLYDSGVLNTGGHI